MFARLKESLEVDVRTTLPALGTTQYCSPFRTARLRCLLQPRRATFAFSTWPGCPTGLPTEAALKKVAGRRLVGLTRFELVTPRLSSVCSNQLSYRPRYSFPEGSIPSKLDRRAIHKALKARSIIEKLQRSAYSFQQS
jgi:hypothetical protein